MKASERARVFQPQRLDSPRKDHEVEWREDGMKRRRVRTTLTLTLTLTLTWTRTLALTRARDKKRGK